MQVLKKRFLLRFYFYCWFDPWVILIFYVQY
jgi:hypothetical protein